MDHPGISMDTEAAEAVPYFNWDTPVTNAELREVLRTGSEAERLPWIARIMREAKYEDVWRYVSLPRDILPAWDRLARMLGRRRSFWQFLIDEWNRAGLLE